MTTPKTKIEDFAGGREGLPLSQHCVLTAPLTRGALGASIILAL